MDDTLKAVTKPALDAFDKHQENQPKARRSRPCPFCGHRYILIIGAMGEFWSLCICGTSGKMCNTEQTAYEFWNTRFEDK